MCQVICCVIVAVVECRSSEGGSPIIAALRTPPVRGCSWAPRSLAMKSSASVTTIPSIVFLIITSLHVRRRRRRTACTPDA